MLVVPNIKNPLCPSHGVFIEGSCPPNSRLLISSCGYLSMLSTGSLCVRDSLVCGENGALVILILHQ